MSFLSLVLFSTKINQKNHLRHFTSIVLCHRTISKPHSSDMHSCLELATTLLMNFYSSFLTFFHITFVHTVYISNATKLYYNCELAIYHYLFTSLISSARSAPEVVQRPIIYKKLLSFISIRKCANIHYIPSVQVL